MSRTVEGIYRDGRVELFETPADVAEARVVVTFLDDAAVDLAARGIAPEQSADLRARLSVFAEDWERPEMGAYDAL